MSLLSDFIEVVFIARCLQWRCRLDLVKDNELSRFRLLGWRWKSV
jgi:hypothetical protein